MLRFLYSNAVFTPAVFEKKINGYQLKKNSHSLTHQFGREIMVSVDNKQLRHTAHSSVNTNRRIHLFGDSQVFGWGLSDEETIASQLQSILGDHSQVLNHGVPGTGPIDYIEKARSVPENDTVIFFLTEENDLWDMFNLGKGASVDCHFLVSINTGVLSSFPCFIKELRVLQLILEKTDKIVHYNRPTPIGFSLMSQAAARPLSYRLSQLIEKFKKSHRGHVYVATIPWKGRWKIKNQQPYSPTPLPAKDIPDMFVGDFSIIDAFSRQSQLQSLYLEGDSHLSPLGSELVAKQLAIKISN